MIGAQAIWGLFLAGLLGFCFHRAWRWEHGAAADLPFGEKNGKETYVLVPPTVLFWILLAFFAVFVLRFGARDGFVRFATLCADAFAILSAYYVLLLALLPLLRRRVSARACAVLWLVPAFLFWQVHALIRALPLPRLTVYIPRGALPMIGAIWFAGFLAVGGYYLVSHLVFRSRVRDITYPERDSAVLELWERERAALDYKRPVELLRGKVTAPFSMGKTKRGRCTVLPEHAYSPEELSMIFRHELHHLQRCDVDTKVFLCLCNAFCWFNPLVWLATRKAAEDLERSCDEIVTEEMDAEKRKAYARLLLSSAAPGRGCTTCLSAAAGTLRYRLKSVTDRRRRALGTLLLMAALFTCVMCFGSVSLSDARGSFTELLLPPGTEILRVYGQRYSAASGWDEEALREALDSLELEHVAGLRGPAVGSADFTLVLSGGNFAFLSETTLIVDRYSSGKDCFLVKSGWDPDALRAAIFPEGSV